MEIEIQYRLFVKQKNDAFNSFFWDVKNIEIKMERMGNNLISIYSLSFTDEDLSVGHVRHSQQRTC